MTQLFAGKTRDGDTRFIGEVLRGKACNCFCAWCGSPLIARHGDINEWHFGHESSQERPECVVGAINLLRRLATEYLMSEPKLRLPVYRQTLSRPARFGVLQEVVEWDEQPIRTASWNVSAPKESSVAVLTLGNGVEINLHVEISDQRPAMLHGSRAQGKIVFVSRLPSDLALRTQESALSYLKQDGQFIWVYQPDPKGLLMAAHHRLLAKVEEQESRLHPLEQISVEREIQLSPGRLWAMKAEKLQQAWTNGGSFESGRPEPAKQVVSKPLWESERDPLSSYFFYRLKSDDAWIMFKRHDGTHAIVPWPSAVEGWEEALPPKVGTFEVARTAYRVHDIGDAMMWLGTNSKVVRITGDLNEIAGL
jgi:hypothetical protein